MDGYTQDKINALTFQLETAFNQLVLATNYQFLIELLEMANSIDLNKYTNESVEVLNHVISQVIEMIKASNSQQNEVNKMVNQL